MNGGKEGREGTHVDDLDTSELCELPCLAYGESTISIEF